MQNPIQMKRFFICSVFLVAILLFACQPPVTFDTPQPADVKSISSFPARLQGKYLNSADSSLLQITSSSIIRIYDYDLKTHVSQIDSTKQLIGDTLFDLVTNKGAIVHFEGDSIVQHVNETDTLFRIDAMNVLKKYKGYYFANILVHPSKWQVKELDFSRGSLTIASINKKEDIQQLKTLTGSVNDTVPYVFSPTKKQFRQFIRNDGFRNQEMFVKISD